MEGYIEICGTPIEIKAIKSFRIEQREYIYRPVFREIPPKNFLFRAKYRFVSMEPYAAIIDEKKPNSLKFWKKNDSKKYECINSAGRKMSVILEDIPVLVRMRNGQTSELSKTNKNYSLIEEKAPYIKMVEALVIEAKQTFVFYGNNIHLFSVIDNYNKVKEAVNKKREKAPKKEKGKDNNAEEYDKANNKKAILAKFTETVSGIFHREENDNDSEEENTENTGEIEDNYISYSDFESSKYEYQSDIIIPAIPRNDNYADVMSDKEEYSTELSDKGKAFIGLGVLFLIPFIAAIIGLMIHDDKKTKSDKTENIIDRNQTTLVEEKDNEEGTLNESSTEVINIETESATKVVSEEITTESLTYVLDLNDIPSFSDKPYVELNNNEPAFSESEKSKTDVFEYYTALDNLGRCGVACANICKDTMPTEERGEIGNIKPSGWHTDKYNDLIDGNFLYNRCHLIAYSLAGENDNKLNLITGTRYLNTQGMNYFETKVMDYINATQNHVLYRVTPIFEGDNLVAAGVEMEAWSVEDAGEGISYHVFCYNVQPGIEIDYATGENRLNEEVARISNTEELISEKIEITEATSELHTEQTTELITEQTTDLTTEKAEATTDEATEEIERNTTESTEATEQDHTELVEDEKGMDLVLNTNTHKIHMPYCSSVDSMAEKNKKYVYGTIEEYKNQGYKPCQNCLSGY